MFNLDQLEADLDMIAGNGDVVEIGAVKNALRRIKINAADAEGIPGFQLLPMSLAEAVADDASTTLTGVADRRIQPWLITISANDGSAVKVAGLYLTAFTIGGDNQLRGSGYVPAEALDSQATFRQGPYRVLDNGQTLSLTVLNKSGAAADISAVVWCLTAR